MVSTLKWAKCHSASACSCSSPQPTKSDQVQVKELGAEVQGKSTFSDLLFLSCFQTTRPLHCRLLQRCPFEPEFEDFYSFPRSPVWWRRYLVIIVQAVDQLSNRSKTEEKAVKEENSRKLLQYREACASLVEGLTSLCSISCQHALVGLISTVEGERLMDCTCQNPGCSMEKKRVEPCREEVTGQHESLFFVNARTPCITWFWSTNDKQGKKVLLSQMELWTVRHYIETEFCQRSEFFL